MTRTRKTFILLLKLKGFSVDEFEETQDDAPEVPRVEVINSLAELNVFALPRDINYESYVELLNFLALHPDEAVLYCAGSGGDVDYGLASVDLIRKHGKVTGILVGAAYSCSSVIYAACSKRYVGRYGFLGVHRPYINDTHGNSTQLSGHGTGLSISHRQMVEVYVEASQRDSKWWNDKLNKTREGFFTRLNAETLVSIGMASAWNFEIKKEST